MKDSTRRSLRSVYHLALALFVATPVLLSQLGHTEKVTALLGALAVVSKLINALEDANLIPAWLKGDATPVTTPVSTPEPSTDSPASSSEEVTPEAPEETGTEESASAS